MLYIVCSFFKDFLSMNLQECFALLKIDKTYDEKLIKQAYRTRAKELHPDLHQTTDTTEQFRQIKEAYEIILLFIEFRKKHGETIGKKIMEEEQKKDSEAMERVAKARQKKEEKRERETALINKTYNRYIHSWRIYYASVLLLIGLITATLLAYDYEIQGDVTAQTVVSSFIDHKDTAYEDFYVKLNNGMTLAVYPDLYSVCKIGKPFLLERGHFFGEIKNIYEIKQNTIKGYEPISFFNDAWIFLFALLLIPLFSFLQMRPNFTFIFFFIHYNMFIQPLVIVYVLLGVYRIGYLWKVLFS